MTLLTPDERAGLRQFLQERFTLDELVALAFDLGINSHTLLSANTTQLSLALVEYFENRNNLGYLLTEVLRQRQDSDLTQLLAKLPPASLRTKVQIIVAQNMLANPDEMVVFLAGRLGISPDQVELIGAAWGSLRLLTSLPAQAAEALLASGVRVLSGGRYRVRAITGFDSLDPADQQTWRWLTTRHPAWPPIQWKDWTQSKPGCNPLAWPPLSSFLASIRRPPKGSVEPPPKEPPSKPESAAQGRPQPEPSYEPDAAPKTGADPFDKVKPMEANANLATRQYEPLSISVDLRDLILDAYPLGGKRDNKRYPSSVSVQIGRVAVASFEGEAFNHDYVPEVYLPGETVSQKGWFWRRQCFVAEMAKYPGMIQVEVRHKLAGISQTDLDWALARFLYRLRIENPIRLLENEPRWTESEGRDHLKAAITDLIQQEIYAVLSSPDVWIWSQPDIREVAGQIFKLADDKLRAFGLRLESLPASRRFPDDLHEVTLQFKATEEYWLASDHLEPDRLFGEWGWQDTVLARATIGNYTQGCAVGAGLFKAAMDRKDQISQFADWLYGHHAVEAALFLSEIGSDKYNTSEVALTEQVMFSAFRHPMLGLGEWGDTERNRMDATRYRQLEAYMETPAEDRQAAA